MLAEKKQKAYCLYLETGNGLREIAIKVGVARSTVERWSRKGGWVAKRKVSWGAAAEAAAATARWAPLQIRLPSAGDRLNRVLLKAIADWESYMVGQLPRRGLRFSPKQLRDLAEAVAALAITPAPAAPVLPTSGEVPT